jgi:hypothetical protein
LREDGSTLLIFEELRFILVASPCPERITEETASIVAVTPYYGPTSVPKTIYEGLFLGPASSSDMAVYVLSPRHKFIRYKLMKVDPSATYHLSSNPRYSDGSDKYDQVTYHLMPLTTTSQIRENIEAIRAHFDRWRREQRKYVTSQDAETIERFIVSAERSLLEPPPGARGNE